MRQMNTAVNKDERKFSLAMLLLTIVTCLGHSKFMVEYMNATVFAMNYRRGISTRGFMGWILDVVCFIFGKDFYCYKTVFVISTVGYIIYLAVLWYIAKKFYRSFDDMGYAMAFVLVVAPFFIDMFLTHEGYGRTDMYLLALSVVAGYSVLKGKWMILCVICPVAAILIHEGYVFDYYNIVIACLLYKCVFNGEKKKSVYIAWLCISIVAALTAFVWIYFFSKTVLPISDEIFAGIVKDAELLAAPGQEVHIESLRAYVLGEDLTESELTYMADARVALLLFVVMFIPVIKKTWEFIKAVYNESANKKTAIILCLGSLSTLPLFIRKCDYGRWMFALISYYIVMMCLLVIADNKVVKKVFNEQAMKIARDRWQALFYAVYFMLFIPFQTVYMDNICRNIMLVINGLIQGSYF